MAVNLQSMQLVTSFVDLSPYLAPLNVPAPWPLTVPVIVSSSVTTCCNNMQHTARHHWRTNLMMPGQSVHRMPLQPPVTLSDQDMIQLLPMNVACRYSIPGAIAPAEPRMVIRSVHRHPDGTKVGSVSSACSNTACLLCMWAYYKHASVACALPCYLFGVQCISLYTSQNTLSTHMCLSQLLIGINESPESFFGLHTTQLCVHTPKARCF